ncbi:MAG: hypothetical protein IJH39_09925 [Clostridia bacterium]|nr:hypothetical protein [Clostridia bacterium]
MFNQDYDEYLRNVLGYLPNGRIENLYQNEYGQYPIQYEENYWDVNEDDRIRDLEESYPDIYKSIYPIVQKECKNCNRSITKDLVEELTHKIYNQVSVNNEIIVDLNVPNQSNNRNQEGKKENRQCNRGLCDLIKILIIRELLGVRPGRPRPPRPIFPPPRPPRFF